MIVILIIGVVFLLTVGLLIFFFDEPISGALIFSVGIYFLIGGVKTYNQRQTPEYRLWEKHLELEKLKEQKNNQNTLWLEKREKEIR
jgi:uncharacterized membrane protein